MRKNNPVVFILAAAALLFVAGCETAPVTTPQEKAARLSFDDIRPLAVNVAAVNIANNYDPTADSRDVSSLFVMRPDIALSRFADKRLRAGGPLGDLRLTIDSASVHHRSQGPENKMGKWLNMGGTEQYEAHIVFTLSLAPVGNMITGPSSTLTVNRTITIPDNLSIAEREDEQIRMIRLMIADADKAMQDVLKNRMGVLGEVLPDVGAMPEVPARDAETPAEGAMPAVTRQPLTAP